VIDVSVKRYPVTDVLSVAVNDEMETVSEEDVGGIVKAVMVGLVVSAFRVNVAVHV
jgi:hypothetical protein